MASQNSQGEGRKPARTTAQIEADLASSRERLVGTLAELEVRLNPKTLATKQTRRVRDFYVDDDGPRWDHVGITVGAVVAGLVGIRLISGSVRWVFAAPSPEPLPAGIVFVPVPREQVANISDLLGSAV